MKFQHFRSANQRHAAARDDAFFDRRARRVHRVFNAGFLFFHFGFGRRADFDDGDAADQFGETFLQVFRGRNPKRFLRSDCGWF